MKRYLFSLSILFLSAVSFAQTDAGLTEETVQRSTIEGHIYFLAADELKGRKTGTPEIDIAARYIATTFRRYGVKPVPGATEGYFQNIPMATVSKPDEFQVSHGQEVVPADKQILMSGQSVDVTGEMIFLGYGNSEDFKKAGDKVKGKVVLCSAGTGIEEDGFMGPSVDKMDRAKEAGAIGIIELHASQAFQWPNVKNYFESERLKIVDPASEDQSFFRVWVQDYEGKYLESMKKSKDPVQVKIGDRTRVDMPAKNVVGMVEGTDPELKDEFVIYSAHYDHIGIGRANAEGDSIYNGARDNAVGVVTVMSAAENIAKYPTKRSALFILFTGEEMGLIGSNYYADNPLIPMDQMVYCFNSDNGGYNDTSVATIIGLERTTVAAHIKEACQQFGLTAIDDPAPEQGLFDRSDNVSFARKGVPAPTFSLGFRAFDAEIMKYYHQAADNPDNVDYEYLEKFFRAYVLSCRLIANDPETPFWVQGDKYFSAGEALYGSD